jgi:hypothetical protein
VIVDSENPVIVDPVLTCREQPWLLKNSLAESARKNRRARMTYKRFSPNADTFLVIRFKPVFGKTEFFNSYSLYHSLSCHTGITCGRDFPQLRLGDALK